MSGQTAKQSVCSLDSLLNLKCFQLFELFAVLLSTLGLLRRNVASFGNPSVRFRSLGMVLESCDYRCRSARTVIIFNNF